MLLQNLIFFDHGIFTICLINFTNFWNILEIFKIIPTVMVGFILYISIPTKREYIVSGSPYWTAEILSAITTIAWLLLAIAIIILILSLYRNIFYENLNNFFKSYNLPLKIRIFITNIFWYILWIPFVLGGLLLLIAFIYLLTEVPHIIKYEITFFQNNVYALFVKNSDRIYYERFWPKDSLKHIPSRLDFALKGGSFSLRDGVYVDIDSINSIDIYPDYPSRYPIEFTSCAFDEEYFKNSKLVWFKSHLEAGVMY